MSIPRLLDSVIYTHDLSLDGAHLIEASAGTGKTYSIQNIYARLIMEKGFRVSEILVMTFTEAATKELRERLFSILKDLQKRFSGKDCIADSEDVKQRNQRSDCLKACAEQVVPSEIAQKRIELALLEFDNAAISTIHGFCRRVLSKYAFESGAMLSPEIADNKKEELIALTEDWWRQRNGNIPADVTLENLKNYVDILSRKTDYALDECDRTTRDGFLLATAGQIVQRYEDARKERKTMNFDDLLRVLWETLRADTAETGHFIVRLRDEFKAALVDEFQDTDPVQYEIFERIFPHNGNAPRFFVGDPKQAIYSFRGADIFTYIQAKSQIRDENRFSLAVNHRSTKRLVEYANGMFDKGTFQCDEIENETAVSVEKEPKTKGSADRKPLHVIVQAGNRDDVDEVWIGQLLALLREKNAGGKTIFSPRDIAVLTTDNRYNAKILEKLRAKKVPGVIRKSGNVFASAVAREWWFFLQAVANPENPKVLRAALLTVFCRQTLADLSSPDEAEAMAVHVLHFQQLQQKWRRHGLAAVIADIGEDYRIVLARRPDGERQLSDIAQIFELSFAAVKQLGSSLEKFLSWLTDRINNSEERGFGSKGGEKKEQDSDEYARELETDADAVKIMTIHASKGLQFPVVILPLPASERSDPAPWAYHLPDPGDSQRKKLHFSVSEEAAIMAQQEKNQEYTRLYYVAMTRAIERMIVVVQEHKLGSAASALLKGMEARQRDGALYEKHLLLPIGSETSYSSDEADQMDRAAETAHRTFDTALYKGSYTALSPSMETPVADDDGRDDDENDRHQADVPADDVPQHEIFALPRGAAIGNVWHSILEKISFGADETVIRELARREFGAGGFTRQDFIDATCRMVQKTLDYPLFSPAGEKFSLREIPWGRRLSEQEFDFSTRSGAKKETRALKEIIASHWCTEAEKKIFLDAMAKWDKPIPRGFMTGFVDLIFQHGDYYYVVDWKSNALEGDVGNFQADGIRLEMAKHGYFFQYLLYSTVLHCYLKQTLGARYSWAKNFAGVRYYFLRGIAAGADAPVFADRPPEDLLNELGNALGIKDDDGQ